MSHIAVLRLVLPRHFRQAVHIGLDGSAPTPSAKEPVPAVQVCRPPVLPGVHAAELHHAPLHRRTRSNHLSGSRCMRRATWPAQRHQDAAIAAALLGILACLHAFLSHKLSNGELAKPRRRSASTGRSSGSSARSGQHRRARHALAEADRFDAPDIPMWTTLIGLRHACGRKRLQKCKILIDNSQRELRHTSSLRSRGPSNAPSRLIFFHWQTIGARMSRQTLCRLAGRRAGLRSFLKHLNNARWRSCAELGLSRPCRNGGRALSCMKPRRIYCRRP